MIQVGDRLRIKPTICSEEMLQDRGPQPCTVVYVHPERRYYTVRFDFLLGSFAESFPCAPAERNNNDNKEDLTYAQV